MTEHFDAGFLRDKVGRLALSTGSETEGWISGFVRDSEGRLVVTGPEGTPLGGGSSATLTVAASNASKRTRANADFLCDGTSDQVQINEALAALPSIGGKVVLSEGYFTIEAPIVIGKDNVALVGMGKGQPLGATPVKGGSLILRGAGFAGSYGINCEVAERVLFGVTLQDFSIDGMAIAGAVDGIRFRAARSTIRNVWSTRWAGNGLVSESHTFGVYPKASHDNLIENMRVDACSLNGMSFTNGSTDNLIRNSIVSGCTGNGIDMSNGATPSTANMLIGNYIYSHTGKGVVGPLYQTQLVGNRIQDTNGGIYLDNTSAGAGGFQIVGNIVRNSSIATDNTTDGIQLACTAGTARGGVLTGNSFHTDPGDQNPSLNRMRFGINIASSNISGVTIGPFSSGFREASSTFGTAAVQNLGTSTTDVSRPSASGLLATAQGLTAQNFDRQTSQTTQIMIGGTAYGMLLPLREGDRIGNVYVEVGTAGAGMSLFKAGIYSTSGATKYAESENQSALFASGGAKAVPLKSTWVVPATGTYMVVIVATAGTLPLLWRGSNSSSETKIGSNARPFATGGTGLSDLPATEVAFTVSNSPIAYWVGAGA